MRIGFIDTSGWDFNVETPYQRPLGGSHSAVCYLAAALAEAGQWVALVSATSSPGVIRGVTCLSTQTLHPEQLPELDLDVAILLLGAANALKIRQALPAKTKLVLWTQHAADQQAVSRLREPARRDLFDGFALVSEWQREQFLREFQLPPQRVRVLRNAIAPPFLELFPAGGSIPSRKKRPPIIAYTSTPFRGLDVLLALFPKIRAAVPGTRLKVFSDMGTYQMPTAEDEKQYGELYRLAREMDGVEHVGSIAQPQLARELAEVTALTYPNTFPETSCIAVMEALAAGCQVVTSHLGALPETAAGFGRLIPIDQGPAEYEKRFIVETKAALETLDRPETETALRRQVEHVRATCNWSARARDWIAWLEEVHGSTYVPAPVAAEAHLPHQPLPRNEQPMDPYFGKFLELLRRSLGAGGSELALGLTLFSLAASIRAERIIEIGRFRGFSTLALASALRLLDVGWDEPTQHKQRPEVNYADLESPKERRLFSVDPHPTPEADALLAEADLTQYVIKLDRSSGEVKFQGEVDLIFIDGEHTYDAIVADIQRLVPTNLRVGGYFILHDYFGWYDAEKNNNSPVKQVCDDLVEEGLVEHLLIDSGYQSFMIFRKLPPLAEERAEAKVTPP